MTKQNTTNSGFFGKIETIIRIIPHIYIIFRMLVRFTSYFEEDFFYLKKILKIKRLTLLMLVLLMEYLLNFFSEI